MKIEISRAEQMIVLKALNTLAAGTARQKNKQDINAKIQAYLEEELNDIRNLNSKIAALPLDIGEGKK